MVYWYNESEDLNIGWNAEASVRKFRGKIVSVFVNFEKLTSSHNGQVDLGPTKLLERVEIGCQCKLHVYDTR